MIVRWEGARSRYNHQRSCSSQPHPQNSSVLEAAEKPSTEKAPTVIASTLRADWLIPSQNVLKYTVR
ncbi:hypothetical protein QUB60_20965 [Microcoleus sp. A2-C5]|uniref:hypothetical protein n=1 Tax=Microcoleaceae TaxID=1892252 RepID=UPI0022380F56|nr:hypothetical protein [Lyngbya sp. CCAP 1446/10]MCW6050780.1 hypothetical protein [Lyngbya sp. CCAP 1446/10]